MKDSELFHWASSNESIRHKSNPRWSENGKGFKEEKWLPGRTKMTCMLLIQSSIMNMHSQCYQCRKNTIAHFEIHPISWPTLTILISLSAEVDMKGFYLLAQWQISKNCQGNIDTILLTSTFLHIQNWQHLFMVWAFLSWNFLATLSDIWTCCWYSIM